MCVKMLLPLQINFLTETSAKALGEKLAQLKHTWLQLCCADCWTVPNQVLIHSFFLVLSLTSSIHKLRSPRATCQNSTESTMATETSTLCIYLNTLFGTDKGINSTNIPYIELPDVLKNFSFNPDLKITSPAIPQRGLEPVNSAELFDSGF